MDDLCKFLNCQLCNCLYMTLKSPFGGNVIRYYYYYYYYCLRGSRNVRKTFDTTDIDLTLDNAMANINT